MQLVERHLVTKDDPRFSIIDVAAFASKNLYNQANDQIHQAYLHEGKYLPYPHVFYQVKGLDCYKALPTKVGNSILIQLHKNWLAIAYLIFLYAHSPRCGLSCIKQYAKKVKFINTPQEALHTHALAH